MRLRRFVLGILLLLPAPLSAQTISDYTVRYYLTGAAAPLQTQAFTASSVTCNLPPPPPTSVINPTRLLWDDPANAGQVCQYVPGTGDVLLSFPAGAYEGTLAASNAGGVSGESARAPFSRVNPPLVPVGFRVVR